MWRHLGVEDLMKCFQDIVGSSDLRVWRFTSLVVAASRVPFLSEREDCQLRSEHHKSVLCARRLSSDCLHLLSLLPAALSRLVFLFDTSSISAAPLLFLTAPDLFICPLNILL